MICQSSFTNCDKCTSLKQDVDSGGDMYGTREFMETLCTLYALYCEIKIVPKVKSILAKNVFTKTRSPRFLLRYLLNFIIWYFPFRYAIKRILKWI